VPKNAILGCGFGVLFSDFMVLFGCILSKKTAFLQLFEKGP
jgi:hypothetical protein